MQGGQFGELSLLYPDRPTAAYVICAEPLEALVLLRTDFEELQSSQPEFQLALAKRVEARACPYRRYVTPIT